MRLTKIAKHISVHSVCCGYDEIYYCVFRSTHFVSSSLLWLLRRRRFRSERSLSPISRFPRQQSTAVVCAVSIGKYFRQSVRPLMRTPCRKTVWLWVRSHQLCRDNYINDGQIIVLRRNFLSDFLLYIWNLLCQHLSVINILCASEYKFYRRNAFWINQSIFSHNVISHNDFGS